MAHEWFDVVRFPSSIVMIAEPGHSENVKSYLVEGDQFVAVLDTGLGVGDFAELVRSLSDREPIVVQSHAHFDHIGASASFAKVLVHPSEAQGLRDGYPNERFRPWFEPEHLRGRALPAGFDPATASIAACEPSGWLQHGDRIDLGGRSLEVYHTPGHSPGGITLFDRDARALFPGDAIYRGPMFAYRDATDPTAYRASLKLIAELAADADAIYPSHNQSPLTPRDAIAIHEAYELVWAGRAPDERLPDRDVFRFDGFQFWLRPGAYGVHQE